MQSSIEVQGVKDTMEALDGVGRQAPFAMSRALNAAANAGQEAVREHVKRVMIMRRPDFVLRTVYRRPGEDFATKGKLEAAVRIHPERNQLAKFVDGGVKSPEASVGGSNDRGRKLAVPAEVRRGKTGVIPPALRIKALQLKPVEKYVENYWKKGAANRTAARSRDGETAISGLQKTFLTSAGIWQRVGKSLRLLYHFRDQTKVPAILPMDTLVRDEVNRVWDRVASEAIEEAMRTAR